MMGQEELSFINSQDRVEELRRMSVSRHVSLQGNMVISLAEQGLAPCDSHSSKPVLPFDQQPQQGLDVSPAVSEAKNTCTKKMRRISFSAVKAEFLFHVQNVSY
jgi:hypothetical protein